MDYDDRYEPMETVSNTERLIDRDKVFALLDFLGTPTCRAILPMVNEANIVLLGPISGAVILRQPMQRLIFNTRASYDRGSGGVGRAPYFRSGLQKNRPFSAG